jgi:hypothetical protein
VLLCNLVFNIIFKQLRISFTSTRMCFGKVQGSLHVGRAITLLRSYRTEEKIPHSDGSIGWCTSNGISDTKYPLAWSIVILHSYFTSQMLWTLLPTRLARSSFHFIFYTQSGTSVIQDLGELFMQHWNIAPITSFYPDLSGPHFMHGPLFMHTCSLNPWV